MIVSILKDKWRKWKEPNSLRVLWLLISYVAVLNKIKTKYTNEGGKLVQNLKSIRNAYIILYWHKEVIYCSAKDKGTCVQTVCQTFEIFTQTHF